MKELSGPYIDQFVLDPGTLYMRKKSTGITGCICTWSSKGERRLRERRAAGYYNHEVRWPGPLIEQQTSLLACLLPLADDNTSNGESAGQGEAPPSRPRSASTPRGAHAPSVSTTLLLRLAVCHSRWPGRAGARGPRPVPRSYEHFPGEAHVAGSSPRGPRPGPAPCNDDALDIAGEMRAVLRAYFARQRSARDARLI